MLLIYFVVLGVSLVETRWLKSIPSTWTCEDGSVPCLWKLGTCIQQEKWCDGETNCPYGSDEAYCDESKCLDGQFICNNGRCIPTGTVCNGYDNCGDGSDEVCENRTTDYSKAVIQAAHYLLSLKEADNWGDLTPRVLIALSFSEKYLPIPEEEKTAMIRALDLQLLHLLREGIAVLPLHQLAVAVNALYATCEDPRNFHEMDLIDIMRIRTNEALKSDFNLPIVFLSLCLAKETRYEDFDKLLEIHDRKRSGMGQKALTLIAMAACKHLVGNDQHNEMLDRVQEFAERFRIQDGTGIYSKALGCQALNAWGLETSQLQKELLRHQKDGSFGDILATYAAIPALQNASLADLQCKSRLYSAKPRLPTRGSKRKQLISYSLVIPDGENIGTHTLNIEFEGKKSLYELMKMAEEKGSMYRFTFEELETGKVVATLNGISNDLESALTWNLYKKSNDHSIKEAVKETAAIDWIYPEDGDAFTFQLEYSGL